MKSIELKAENSVCAGITSTTMPAPSEDTSGYTANHKLLPCALEFLKTAITANYQRAGHVEYLRLVFTNIYCVAFVGIVSLISTLLPDHALLLSLFLSFLSTINTLTALKLSLEFESHMALALELASSCPYACLATPFRKCDYEKMHTPHFLSVRALSLAFFTFCTSVAFTLAISFALRELGWAHYYVFSLACLTSFILCISSSIMLYWRKKAKTINKSVKRRVGELPKCNHECVFRFDQNKDLIQHDSRPIHFSSMRSLGDLGSSHAFAILIFP